MGDVTRIAALGLAALAGCGLGGAAAAAPAPADPLAAIAAGKPIVELRLRYEGVDQANLAARADSLSLRARFGWETAAWRGIKVLVEGESAFHADHDHYNVAVPGGVSLNGRTQYPIINDPGFFELNRAQLTWALTPQLSVTAGRQRILIDDQRFVGNVGWRQDEQTFDAARADLKIGPRFSATYAYVFRVNRIFGQQLDWGSDSHLFNAALTIDPRLKVEGFIYALDFGAAAASSTLTRGARASGKFAARPLTIAWDATYARQSRWGNNPASFGLDFWQASASLAWRRLTLKGDYELLGGNGTRGFVTPLATTHGFQGWADAWGAVGGNKTHVDGLKDLNFSLAWKAPLPRLGNPELLVRHHDFWAERTGAKLADEWDAQVSAPLTPHLTAAIKCAAFRREAAVPAGTTLAPPSRTKVWATLEFKL
jgi:hypothetical protein